MDEGEDLFKEAENSLRSLGSHLWFGSLPRAWQQFFIANTIDIFEKCQRRSKSDPPSAVGDGVNLTHPGSLGHAVVGAFFCA